MLKFVWYVPSGHREQSPVLSFKPEEVTIQGIPTALLNNAINIKMIDWFIWNLLIHADGVQITVRQLQKIVVRGTVGTVHTCIDCFLFE